MQGSSALDVSTFALPAPTADHQLSRLALRWIASLPISVRPIELGKAHPRLVNRLSLCWKDHALTTRVLTGLMVDRRGNRKGFPKAIVVELLEL